MTPDQNQYEQLKNLIGQDKLEEVFKQLHELIPADAPESTSLILLEGQFRSNQREEQLNKTDRDAIRRTTTHISEGLLMLIDSLTEEQIQLETIAQLSFNDRLHRIRAFFTDYDRLPHAFSHLEHLLKEYSPNLLTELNDLRVKLNANRKEYIIKRKIERQTYLQSSGQIVEGLEELIRQLSETETKISGKDVQFGSELSKVNCDRKKILRRFRAVMGSDPSFNTNCDDCPVEQVSWNGIQEFLQKLNAQTGQNYWLPTEAEWEYAARGGNQSQNYLYSGSNDIDEVAWYADNYESGNIHGTKKTTCPVGGKKANELGLYDMSGNVYEWCSDWYDDYSGEAQQNPRGPDKGSARVDRGGGWGYPPQGCRAAYRSTWTPTLRGGGIGFRLARS